MRSDCFGNDPPIGFSALAAFVCAVFAKNTRHVAAWEDENDYVDYSRKWTKTQATNTTTRRLISRHSSTTRLPSEAPLPTEKWCRRDDRFHFRDDYAAAGVFRFCVKHDMFHHNHVRSVTLKIKEEIEKMPEEDRPIGERRGRRGEEKAGRRRGRKRQKKRYEAVREYLNETLIIKAGEELSRLVEEYQDHQLNSDEHIEQDREGCGHLADL